MEKHGLRDLKTSLLEGRLVFKHKLLILKCLGALPCFFKVYAEILDELCANACPVVCRRTRANQRASCAVPSLGMAHGVRAAARAVTPTDQKFGIATHIHASYGAQWRVFENVRLYLA